MRLVLPLGLLLTVASTAFAQGAYTGSQTYIGFSPSLQSVAAESASTSYGSLANIGSPIAGASASNATYAVSAGALGAFKSLALGSMPPPIVTLVTPSQGAFDANDEVSIYGRYFDAPGVLLVDVSFGGVPAASPPFVVSDSLITAIAPIGTDALPNPNTLGQVDVTVTTTFGSGVLCSGYTFLPAVFVDGKSQQPTQQPLVLDPDGAVEIVPAPAGSPADLVVVGISGYNPLSPPPAIPVPPYTGSVVLDTTMLLPAIPLLPTPSGSYLITYDVASSLNLIGVTLAVQALPIDIETNSGQFTNLITFVFQ